MKETTKMSRVIGTLEKMYRTINQEKFCGILPTPIITVQSKPGTYGHCTCSHVWKRKEDTTFELNIAAEALAVPIEETLNTIIHEMVHLYCIKMGIKDTSRKGTYHNKHFKEEAEKVGLECYYTGERYGWNTKGSEKLIEYAIEHGWSEFLICRNQPGLSLAELFTGLDLENATENNTRQTPGKKPSHIRKYECTKCKNNVRASKKTKVICGYCMVEMIEVTKI